ncbi:DUF1700 domain-containing protein [Tyzzerella sp. An114]|uniref:DUF1700 domain-containing protein n=1 Tax=Tyzzerella sp. An114 TaxID=1965545 RepID=UPI001302B7AB|nr:DUF1700 domain-containing protein [Tyzzerella sp. An114]
MNKEEYLQKLEQYLKKYLSRDEIEDILMDYGEYFEDGRRQNKSDIEISAKLGDPEVIASQFIDEVREERRKKHEDEMEKIKDTASSVVKNIKEKTEFLGRKSEKDDDLTYVRVKRNEKGIFQSIIDFMATIVKAIFFGFLCFIIIGAVFTILGILGSAVLFCAALGIGGVVFSVSVIGFVSGFIIASGVFGSIFVLGLAVMLTLLFIVVIQYTLKCFKYGFDTLFIKKEVF